MAPMLRSAVLAVCGLLLVPGMVSADVPIDRNGLPLWEIRSWDDVPVLLRLDGPDDLRRLLEAVPIADFQREQVTPVRGAAGLELRTRVNEAELAALRAAGREPLPQRDREREGREAVERAWASAAAKDGAATWTFPLNAYPTHAEVGEIIDEIVAAHPTLARAYQWGTSAEGRELWGLVISANVDDDEAEPEVRLSSTIHGDEPVGVVLTLNFADHLTSHYGQTGYEDVTALVDGFEIHLLPLHNPDGYVAGRRYNTNGVDLNRNFDEPAGTHATREPETLAFMAHALDHRFVISGNYHGGALVVNYPWDWTYDRAPDDAALIRQSLAYSATNLPMFNGAFDDGITNGADWYVATGTLQDWVYELTDCSDVTIEVSNAKWPAASTLTSYWDDNRQSMLNYVAAAGEGVHGVVTSSSTGLPLGATVTVAGIAKAVGTDPARGDYAKLLDTGVYDVTFEAAGHEPLTVEDVSVTWGTPVRLDAALDPVGGSSTTLFADDFDEGDAAGWTGDWTVIAGGAEGSPYAMADSEGDYVPDVDTACAMISGVDLGGLTAATVSFQARWDVEANWDGVSFDVSTDGGASWTSLAAPRTDEGGGQGAQTLGDHYFEGLQEDFVLVGFDLTSWLGETDVRFRFRLVSDGTIQRDGFVFDDFAVLGTGGSVAGDGEPPAPAAQLTGIQPNPFNPGTTVRCRLARAGHAVVTLYDVTGRLVRTLHDGALPAGDATFAWDGFDAAGAPAPSGVYVVRLKALGEERARKAVLLK